MTAGLTNLPSDKRLRTLAVAPDPGTRHRDACSRVLALHGLHGLRELHALNTLSATPPGQTCQTSQTSQDAP